MEIKEKLVGKQVILLGKSESNNGPFRVICEGVRNKETFLTLSHKDKILRDKNGVIREFSLNNVRFL